MPYEPDANRYSESCYENPNHEAADLCAQWSAADAAKEAAGLSYWGNWISGVGALLSFASIILVLFALKQGRDANRIAEDTAKRELRAYVIPQNHQVTKLATGKRPTFIVRLHNSGQTPAYDVRCVTTVVATVDDVDNERVLFRLKPKGATFSRDVIGGGDYKVLPNSASDPFDADVMQMIAQNHLKLIFAGVLSYRDVFGKRHLGTFRTYLAHTGDRSQTTFDLTTCARGNKGN